MTTPKARRQRPPSPLGPAGSRLWVSITDKYELSQAELALLWQASRCADQIDVLDELAAGQPMVLTAKGDSVVNPAVTEVRQQRVLLSRLIASMRIPEHGVAAKPARRRPGGGARPSRGVYPLRSTP
jgi:hypothetical protein